MVHCNPAPPHPPPGEIYNAMCPPPGGWELTIGMLLVALVVLRTVVWIQHYNSKTP